MAHLQAFQAVKSINPFMIHSPALPLQEGVNPSVAIAHPGGSNLLDPVSQRGLLSLAGAVVEGGTRAGERLRGPPDAHLVAGAQKLPRLPPLSRP